MSGRRPAYTAENEALDRRGYFPPPSVVPMSPLGTLSARRRRARASGAWLAQSSSTVSKSYRTKKYRWPPMDDRDRRSRSSSSLQARQRALGPRSAFSDTPCGNPLVSAQFVDTMHVIPCAGSRSRSIGKSCTTSARSFAPWGRRRTLSAGGNGSSPCSSWMRGISPPACRERGRADGSACPHFAPGGHAFKCQRGRCRRGRTRRPSSPRPARAPPESCWGPGSRIEISTTPSWPCPLRAPRRVTTLRRCCSTPPHPQPPPPRLLA